MADCPLAAEIRDALPDLVNDQLDPLARARVEQHIAECAECAAELKLLRSLRATIFATPRVDAARVAAAVHAATAGARESKVTPITARSERRKVASPVARAARRQLPYEWRAAAGIAAVAVGIAGYALSRGSTPASPPAMETAPVAAAPARAVAPSIASSKAAADLAGGAGASTPGSIILGDGVSDLSESDMQTLLQAVDDLEAMPDLEPQEPPLLAGSVEEAL
jgi:anti-sigma factor RsiW